VHFQNLAGLQQEHRQKLADLKNVHSDDLQKKQREIQDAVEQTLWKHSKYLKLFEDMSCKRAVLTDNCSSWFLFFLCVCVWLAGMVHSVIHSYITCRNAPTRQKDIYAEVLECADDRRGAIETARAVAVLDQTDCPNASAYSVAFAIASGMLQVPRNMFSEAQGACARQGRKLEVAVQCVRQIQLGSLSPSNEATLLNRIVLCCTQESDQIQNVRWHTATKWMRVASSRDDDERLRFVFRAMNAYLLMSKKWVDSLRIDHGEGQAQAGVSHNKDDKTTDRRLKANRERGKNMDGTPDRRFRAKK
jgi:hypothetical protein